MEKYSEDLNFLLNYLEDMHPDLYRFISKDKITEEIDKIKSIELNDRVFYLEVKKLLALFRDGHTMVYDFNQDYSFSYKIIKGKVFIIEDNKNRNSSYLYKEVTHINDKPMRSIIDIIKIYASNETKRNRIASMENILGCYHLMSVILDTKDIVLTLEDGTKVNLKEEVEKTPYSNHKNFKNNFDKKSGSYIIKYGSCMEEKGLIFENWFKSIDEDMYNLPIKRIIVDLRGNVGGNSENFKGLVEVLSKYNRLVAITDEHTFSSGLFALVDLINLGAYTIGTLPGSKKHHFGYVDKTGVLPNTKIKFGCSNSFWLLEEDAFIRYRKSDIHKIENLDERLKEDWIFDCEVELDIESLKKGIDNVLETAISFKKGRVLNYERTSKNDSI